MTVFRVIEQDKANHEVYGARIGTVAAVIAIFATTQIGWVQFAALAGAVAAVVTATGAGIIKERLDREANEDAIFAGEAPPHSVEGADIKATAIGGIVVALPLIVLWLTVFRDNPRPW
jgi:hypothetical protein